MLIQVFILIFIISVVSLVQLNSAQREKYNIRRRQVSQEAKGEEVFSALFPGAEISISTTPTPIVINSEKTNKAKVSSNDTYTDRKPETKQTTVVPTHSTRKVENKLVVLVLSAREHRSVRDSIRNTWAKGHANVFFVVGKPCMYRKEDRVAWTCDPKQNVKKMNENDMEEVEDASDVITVDVIDVYRNLASKLHAAYYWVLEHTDAHYILKTDDDTFVRVESLEKWLTFRDAPRYEIIAADFSKDVEVTRQGKWAEVSYRENKYPAFPRGSGHVVTRAVLEYMHEHDSTWKSYQGEDTSMGIWMDSIKMDVKIRLTSSAKFVGHSGNCHDATKYVIGHEISPEKMRNCYFATSRGKQSERKHSLSWSQDVCTNKPTGKMWQAFTSMVEILERLKAQYTIFGGTVLSWYRDCSLGASDIDMGINLYWFQEHERELNDELVMSGWRLERSFGSKLNVGYEESWRLNGVKCDLFSTKPAGGIFINGLTVNGVTYPCKSFFTRVEKHKWNGVSFKAPAPLETYLENMYGDWKTKHIRGYQWDIEPFKSDRHFCSKTETFDDMEESRCLRLSLENYTRNLHPVYDTDTPVREGKLYQFNVYNRAMTLAQKFGKKWIIDIGCGSGRKLAAMHSFGFKVVGIDFGANLKTTMKKVSVSDTVLLRECNLNKDMPDIPETIIRNAVFVSADVIEHLTNPDNLIKIVKRYIDLGALGVVSTPDNDKLSRTLTPQRLSDVQVWSKAGFATYFKCHGIKFHLFERFNNNVDMIKNGVGVQIGSSVEPINFFANLQEPRKIEILISTMGRHDKVFELVASIKEYHTYSIIVADDGRESMKDLYTKKCPACSYYWVGYDKGLSYKRNFLVKTSTSDFVVLLDDDMIWTESVDVHKALELLKKDTDIVGFKLDDRELYPVKTRIVNKTLSRCKIQQTSANRCFDTDYVLNVFIAKRSVLLKNKWDEDLKLAEHSAFFFMLKENRVRVKLCMDMFIKHNNKKRSVYQDSNYDVMRSRASKEYMQIVSNKYGFSKVLDTYPPCQQ
jgi:beta-1,3-N-acetylgalactosaminyltransferase 2